MTYSPDLAGLRAAVDRARFRQQYRVSVSPGALGALIRERDELALRVEELEARWRGPTPEDGPRRKPPPPDERPRIVL